MLVISLLFLMTQDRPGFNEDGSVIKLTKRKKLALVADRVIVQGLLGNTVGRVGKVAGRLLLGRIPETAKQGSYQDEKPLDDAVPFPTSAAEDIYDAPERVIETKAEEPRNFIDSIDEGDKSILEDEIFDQVFASKNKVPIDGESSGEREWKVVESEKSQELSKA